MSVGLPPQIKGAARVDEKATQELVVVKAKAMTESGLYRFASFSSGISGFNTSTSPALEDAGRTSSDFPLLDILCRVGASNRRYTVVEKDRVAALDYFLRQVK